MSQSSKKLSSNLNAHRHSQSELKGIINLNKKVVVTHRGIDYLDEIKQSNLKNNQPSLPLITSNDHTKFPLSTARENSLLFIKLANGSKIAKGFSLPGENNNFDTLGGALSGQNIQNGLTGNKSDSRIRLKSKFLSNTDFYSRNDLGVSANRKASQFQQEHSAMSISPHKKKVSIEIKNEESPLKHHDSFATLDKVRQNSMIPTESLVLHQTNYMDIQKTSIPSLVSNVQNKKVSQRKTLVENMDDFQNNRKRIPNIFSNKHKQSTENNLSKQNSPRDGLNTINSHSSNQKPSIKFSNLDKKNNRITSNTDEVDREIEDLFNDFEITDWDKKGELILENRFIEMYNSCDKDYQKQKILKSIETLNSFREKTNANSDLHQTFRFLLENESSNKLKDKSIKDKWSEMKWLGFNDQSLKKNVDLERLGNMVQKRLQTLEKEENIISRKMEQSRQSNKTHGYHTQSQDFGLTSGFNTNYNSTLQSQYNSFNGEKSTKKDQINDNANSMLEDIGLNPLDNLIKDIHSGYTESADRFAGNVKNKHRFYQKNWQTLPNEIHKLKRRNNVITKGMMFKDLNNYNSATGLNSKKGNFSGLSKEEQKKKATINHSILSLVSGHSAKIEKIKSEDISENRQESKNSPLLKNLKSDNLELFLKKGQPKFKKHIVEKNPEKQLSILVANKVKPDFEKYFQKDFKVAEKSKPFINKLLMSNESSKAVYLKVSIDWKEDLYKFAQTSNNDGSFLGKIKKN